MNISVMAWKCYPYYRPCTRGTTGPLQWRHKERDGVSNQRRLGCLHNCLYRRRSKKTARFGVTGFCKGNPPVTGGFPSQRTSNAENVFDWWRHHARLDSPRKTYKGRCFNYWLSSLLLLLLLLQYWTSNWIAGDLTHCNDFPTVTNRCLNGGNFIAMWNHTNIIQLPFSMRSCDISMMKIKLNLTMVFFHGWGSGAVLCSNSGEGVSHFVCIAYINKQWYLLWNVS